MEISEYEINAAAQGYTAVCGIDEAGRGPLAGPVFAAAVILPEGCVIEGLNDSKKLSEKKREQLFDEIRERALSFGIASASCREVDEVNILNATFLAMCRAAKQLDPAADFALVDGNRIPHSLEIPCQTVVKGDSLCQCIAAASILAKVSRDRYMMELSEKYPQYCFDRHKGYGTKLHYEMIAKYGPCDEHRRTFLKKLH